MSGRNDPIGDLEELKARIREQAAGMRERAATEVPLAVRGSDAWVFNWLEVKGRLKVAANLAQLSGPPLMQRFHGLKRRAALAAARVVLYFARFLTSRQTDFNVCLLDTLREMGEALHLVETRMVQQQEQIRLLEACLSQLQLRVSSLSANSVRRELERKAS